jgi:hypothetical protein
MADPFQGIDDGLGGKLWPTLPQKFAGASAHADGWMIPQDKLKLEATEADKLGLEASSKLGCSSTKTSSSLGFSSPTSVLDMKMWASPITPASRGGAAPGATRVVAPARPCFPVTLQLHV